MDRHGLWHAHENSQEPDYEVIERPLSQYVLSEDGQFVGLIGAPSRAAAVKEGQKVYLAFLSESSKPRTRQLKAVPYINVELARDLRYDCLHDDRKIKIVQEGVLVSIQFLTSGTNFKAYLVYDLHDPFDWSLEVSRRPAKNKPLEETVHASEGLSLDQVIDRFVDAGFDHRNTEDMLRYWIWFTAVIASL